MELVLNRYYLESKKIIHFDQDVILKEEDIALERDIISVENVHFKGKAQYVSGLIILNIEVNAKLVLRSTRTLKPVPYEINEKEELTLTYTKDDILEDSDIILVEGEDFDLYQEILSLIITSIPMKIIAKDDPSYLKGDGWELISEDDYNKKKSENIDPRMEKLLDFDLEDDE